MMNLKDTKLQFKLAWPILIVITTILGSYFFYNLNEKRNLSYSNLEQISKAVAVRLEKSLASLLWHEDLEIAKTILESEGKKDVLNSIVILDEDKKEVIIGFKKIIKKGKEEISFKENISTLFIVIRGSYGKLFSLL